MGAAAVDACDDGAAARGEDGGETSAEAGAGVAGAEAEAVAGGLAKGGADLPEAEAGSVFAFALAFALASFTAAMPRTAAAKPKVFSFIMQRCQSKPPRVK